jgi:hypothetical protein
MDAVEDALRMILAEERARQNDLQRATHFANIEPANDGCCCGGWKDNYCAHDHAEIPLAAPHSVL